MFPKIFKLTDKNRNLLNDYNREMWRFAHNSELFGSYKSFSFKSRCKYVFTHPIRFIKDFYVNRDMALELIKAWYIRRQYPLGIEKNKWDIYK